MAGYLHTADMHADAMGLHDSGLAIDVDDKPRQEVAFTVDQTVGVVLRIVGNTDGLAHPKGRGQARLPKVGIDGHIVE